MLFTSGCISFNVIIGLSPTAVGKILEIATGHKTVSRFQVLMWLTLQLQIQDGLPQPELKKTHKKTEQQPQKRKLTH